MQEGQKQAPMVMCLLDNRGVGQSSSPQNTRDYSTALMASDVHAVMVWPLLVTLSMGLAALQMRGWNVCVCVQPETLSFLVPNRVSLSWLDDQEPTQFSWQPKWSSNAADHCSLLCFRAGWNAFLLPTFQAVSAWLHRSMNPAPGLSPAPLHGRHA